MVPLTSVFTVASIDALNVQNSITTSNQMFSVEELIIKPTRFKCDETNCTKEFLSEEKLLQHKNTHKKDSRAQRPTKLECPVISDCGGLVKVPCGKIFTDRGELIKHLNEDHTTDDGAYKCKECDRRFFWAVSLRAHQRCHESDRVTLVCQWPGCGRVFRQPCRLREHSRAHTGDKPYPCTYPNCGWSFRTASKLLRHSRRHTGERRHPCKACGRAFLRREHMKEHYARYHSGDRTLTICPVQDCNHTVTNASSLYTHMKKAHGSEDRTLLKAALSNHKETKKKSRDTFVVNLWENPSAEIGQDEELSKPMERAEEIELQDIKLCLPSVVSNTEKGCIEVIEEPLDVTRMDDSHSARTHCTWPLQQKNNKDCGEGYELEDYVLKIEEFEGSDSNIYTVRSDLFLHGNVLHNEDSKEMCEVGVERSESSAMGGGGSAVETRGLVLADLPLDAPSLDLDQEELYTDPVDETSFWVFLLSGENLT